ncbi:MAG: phospholipase D family protein [Pacificimonas sp.]|jgi:putative cardiolipin synthase|nr:phospholipase D family protein [Pacificimonas sp.]
MIVPAFLLALAALVGTLLVIRLLNPLPPLEPRPNSQAATGTVDTALGRSIAPLTDAKPDLSGVYMLSNGEEAYGARALLARTAERSLDVQYYIWRADLTGILLLRELRAAADRGVRVRLLLDDNGTAGLDAMLAALDAHPQVEVRLFNPFVVRSPKWLGYLTDFKRLNRRMHNKSFTADGQASIVGGRNIGDEYFGAQTGGLFYDLDVLAVGAVVGAVGDDFDRYWSSGSAYPASHILPEASQTEITVMEARADAAAKEPDARAYVDAVETSGFARDLMAGRTGFIWSRVRLLSDDPAKGLGTVPDNAQLTGKLTAAMGEAKREIGIVSGYFVPTKAGMDAFAALAQADVEISVLTNSYAATDVPYVHAGYAPRRKRLLAAGVHLYELRPSYGPGAGRARGGSGSVARSSGSTLHAKTFTVDRERLFVGSFNFDPRSFALNTEMGVVIESPLLAGAVQKAFAKEILDESWHLSLTDEGSILWTAGAESCGSEPGTTWLSRAMVAVIGWLPVEWLL